MPYPLEPLKQSVTALTRTLTGDAIAQISEIVPPMVANRDTAAVITARTEALASRLHELTADLRATAHWPDQVGRIEGRLETELHHLDQALSQAGSVLRELSDTCVDARRGRKQPDTFRQAETALKDAITLKETADEELKTIMDIKDSETRRGRPTGYGDDEALVSAVSRLQGGGSWGGSGEAGSAGDFDKMISQRLGVTLGLPDLNGETAKSQSPTDLLAKLRAGLDRSVLREQQGGETRWRFDPLRARGRGEIAATVSGAQGVVLRNLRALRAPFCQALNDIGSERYRGDWAERDELRAAAEAGFDALITEASQPTGPYIPAVEAAARQIVMDVLTLAALGDVIETSHRYERAADMHLADSAFDGDSSDPARAPSQNMENPDWGVWRDLLDRGERITVSKLLVPEGSAADAATRDPDLGLLDAEANEAALVSALGHVRSAYMLLTRDLGQGARLGRIRVRNDALAAAAGQAETALAKAGLSPADLSATSSGDTDFGVIDAARLLRWIAETAQADRTQLARDDVSTADLRRILRVREAQYRPLADLVAADLPGVPRNRYSAGRRELAEMVAQLGALVHDLRRFVPGSRAQG